ncbi:hypothetical protein LU631_15430 [Erwinia tracheiphila]|uniref:Uncharacterized protein n=1 Tax=Erwinia tracheiphila TaxID=65700 RepID=A0A0M2KBP4_9GAMM|nr:hypothetical protein [Erwinia tracheiphila]AXF75833.1 hypothetical protein AV903_06675 [Erwinia tracheiphila]KKF34702.1 hypothetical protein SY86_03460 [Erwinia tracheiphila]UIA85515.1 hypothetical protein LU604_12550 [Erwinia tracheiphila]UIA86385.1 hypothetical protein LU631_15430 [Erwinia tracheiphila]UIA94036.1 hypothetical protein LU632_12115 [Erwinia tracheiphila]
MASNRKTYNITADRQIRLERLAVDVSHKVGKTFKWTGLFTYIIDKYHKDAAAELLSEEKVKNKQNGKK